MGRTSYELASCPVCGSAESVELADRQAITRERERLWGFHDRRLRAGIPPERLMDRVVFSQEPPVRLARCVECGHVYRNPRERAESLGAAYADDAPADDVLRALFVTQREAYAAQARRLTEVAGRPGRGLEVGSYVGGFLAAARDRGWVFDGVDVSARAVAFAAANGFTITLGEMSAVTATVPYDAIAIWNTFEQLYDARAGVVLARSLLREGGLLAVRIPNGGFYARWRARLDGRLGAVAERLLAHNNLLTFPYRQGFTTSSLELLLRRSGFEIVRVFGDTLVPIADEWTTSFGSIDERIVKRIERLTQRGWDAPWVEVYARAA